jgi:hypothetical protein
MRLPGVDQPSRLPMAAVPFRSVLAGARPLSILITMPRHGFVCCMISVQVASP